MNKKKKVQLIVLCVIFLIVVLAFIALKMYQKNIPDEVQEEEITYQVLNTDASEVTEIGIITEEGTTDLLREDGAWKCLEDESVEIDSSLVESFLENICLITSDTRIENVEDMQQYGLDEPAISVTIQWDNNMYTIKLGDYNSMITSYYISINDENTVYTAESSIYYTLNKSMDSFQKADDTEKVTEQEQ